MSRISKNLYDATLKTLHYFNLTRILKLRIVNCLIDFLYILFIHFCNFIIYFSETGLFFPLGEDGSNYLCPESPSDDDPFSIEMKKRRRRHSGKYSFYYIEIN